MTSKLIFRCLINLISIVPLLTNGQNSISDKSVAKMGASQVNITPDKPTFMSGYGSRTTPFIGVHDSIFASALYFTYEKTKALFISADVVGFSSNFIDTTKKMISSKTGIPLEYIMIAAVHNHGGPVTGNFRNETPQTGYDYPAQLKEKLTSLAVEALKNPVPFHMGIGKGFCNQNINRRVEFADSTIWLGKNPDGPCDHELDVVKFEDMNNNAIAVLVNWPCHGTASGGQNYLITGDWPGAAARYIKHQAGKDVVVAVTAGASADINPLFGPTNIFYEIDVVGFHVGVEAWKTLTQTETFPVKSLQATNTTMTFPGKKPWKGHLPQTSYESGRDREIRLTVLKIGDLVLSGISGELMTEMGMEVKKQSPYSGTLIVTHCNGSSGYICTDKAFSEGGYEPQSTGFMPGVEKPLVNKFIELIHSF